VRWLTHVGVSRFYPIPDVSAAAIWLIPSDAFFDRGESVFEVVLLLLWLGFIAFLLVYVGLLLLESSQAKKRGKKSRKTLFS